MLIVEDHPGSRRALSALMKNRGWTVDEAATVTEGLARLDAGPDCVVLDLMLPDGDGEAIMLKLFEKPPPKPTRVVVCTGLNDPERLDVVHALGPDAVLMKPIRPDELCRACAR
jgi:CheY-like chemotaxis protein